MMHDKSIEYSGASTILSFGFWVIQESSNKFDIVLFNSRKIACVSVHLGILKFRHLFEDSLICVKVLVESLEDSLAILGYISLLKTA